MTKRSSKNAKPVGLNKSLGNALVNRKENKRPTASSKGGVVVEEPKETKVLASVTHENAYEEFFNNAALAGKEFTATRGDFQLLQPTSSVVEIESFQDKSFDDLTKRFGNLLKIPRRPHPDSYSTAEGLEAQEQLAFLQWRRSLANLAEGDGIVLTPFERNLELWRQLWRVVERSDIIVQIVDARNPLLFRNLDLEAYASEFSPAKPCLLVVNKADLLAPEQIVLWKQHFSQNGVNVIFWSAAVADEEESDEKAESSTTEAKPTLEGCITNTEELIDTLKKFALAAKPGAASAVVGMVGYPNVGKSSTINRIVGAKKTSVSATPGKTKHFQTLIVDEEMTLCDCPGLVMPSFGFSPAELLLSGILPVDQMREYIPPVHLLCQRVPRNVLEGVYSIILPKPADFDDPSRPPTAHEFLTTLAYVRGFMTSAGVPDQSRAARLVLKDVFNGKLKWTAAPPGVNQKEFDEFSYYDIKKTVSEKTGEIILDQLERRNYLDSTHIKTQRSKVDDEFFVQVTSGAHVIGGKPGQPLGNTKKHFKGKKDKLRRIHSELDA